MLNKSLAGLILFLCISLSLFAQIPVGYYDGADGKSAAELKTALYGITHNYISADYDGFSATYWGNTYYTKTDWNTGGYFWDMYSNEQRDTYNSSLMSREHCMPRSWWLAEGDYGVANSDLQNLYPSDYTANSKKSNYPLGEVGTISWTNNAVKLGTNTFPGYSGTVFEPADEYKGDFARTYFYMVTSHEDYSDRWSSPMLDNNTYPVFNSWAIDMLLSWARQDTVSQKEIDRNNAVFAIQQNRNPFIDYPDLFEYIWGNKIGESFSSTNKASSATLITPVDGQSIDFGVINTNSQKVRTIPLKTVLLSGNLVFDWEENQSGYFSIAKNSVEAAKVNQVAGDTLNITYAPLAAGSHTANLRITNTESGISSLIQLSATASTVVTVDPVTPDEDTEVIFFYTGPWDTDSLPDNFATNISSVYSNGDLKFSANGNYLTVTFDKSPGYMRFAIYPRNAWGTNKNHLYVYEGTTLSSLGTSAIADFDNSFVTTGDSYNNTPAIALQEDTRAIKIQYAKVAQNAGINNLFVTVRESSSINEENSGSKVKIYSSNNCITASGIADPQNIVVYNLWGQVAYKGLIENDSRIFFPSKGIFVAKIGNYIQKLVF
jgi:endonuclease I